MACPSLRFKTRKVSRSLSSYTKASNFAFRLLHAVLSLRTLSDMLAAVTTIAPQIPDRQLQVGTNEVQEWEQTTLERALDAAESKALGYIDGQSVVHHCLLYRDVMYIQTR